MDKATLKLLLLLFLLFVPISAIDEPTFSYIVLLDKSKMPVIESVLGHEQRYSSITTKLIHVYSSTFHGFAAHMTETQLIEVQKLPEFVASFPDKMVNLHTTHSPEFLKLSPLSGLWPAANYGNDVIIGVIDSGIWPESKSFDDTGLDAVPERWKGICEEGDQFNGSNCNRKLVGARYYYQGYEASIGKIDWATEYKSARDSNGHGTHTASTAGGSVVFGANMFGYASGAATGMAPRARIAVYKVCWGDCASSDILAGINQAVADGVDVLSISLGSDRAVDYDQDVIAIAAFGASTHGVFVSASASNFGPEPATVSNVAPWLTSVAASTINRDFPATLILGNGKSFHGQTLTSSPISQHSSTSLVYLDSCNSSSINSTVVNGKVVVCDGSTGTVSAGIAISEAGGTGMIAVMPSSFGNLARPSIYTLPALAITNADAKQVQQYVNSTKSASARIKFYGTQIGSIRAPQMAYFSSRGPNSITHDVLKPDITAPGYNILAAWSGADSPSEEEGDTRKVLYNIISGTSMACPHISGIAALLKAAHPAWSPAAIRSAIMTTAYTIDNTGKNISEQTTGQPADVFAYGSGHVDPQRALSPGLIYDLTQQDYINFLCSHGYSSTQITTITQDSSISCPSSIPAANDFNYPSLTAALNSTASFVSTTFGRKVTNVGPASSTYFASVVAPKGMTISVIPSKLIFSATTTTLSFQVQVSAPNQKSNTYLSGGVLTWSDGKHLVRSPVTLWFI